MTDFAEKYPLKKDIERAIAAAQDMGLDVGGFEIAPGGVIRVLTKGETKVDEFSLWKKKRAANGN